MLLWMWNDIIIGDGMYHQIALLFLRRSNVLLCSVLQHVQALLFGNEDKTPLMMSLPGMSSFISPDKPNFKITTVQEQVPSSLHAPFTSDTHWNILNSSFPSSHTPGPSTGQPPVHEKRASVIMKTSDVSKSSVKSCWWCLDDTEVRTPAEHYCSLWYRT